MGIDVGTTGLGAVLLDQQNQQLHPIAWQHRVSQNWATFPSVSRDALTSPCFRLPTQMLLIPNRFGNGLSMVPSWGVDGSSKNNIHDNASLQTIVLNRYKQQLNIAIPHYSSYLRRWEPILQAGGYDQYRDCTCAIPLSWLYQALKTLLSTLAPAPPSVSFAIASESPPRQPSELAYQVWGLSEQKARAVLQNLTGVIVGYPASWSAAYRFNVREAVLGARLVTRAAQVLMVNDAIATLLSVLPGADGRRVTLPDTLNASPLQTQGDYQGSTLVLNAGATTTELAIATVVSGVPSPITPPTTRLQLNNLAFRSLAYGGDAVDQDIIGQLLYPRLAQAAMGNNLDVSLNATMGQFPSVQPGSVMKEFNTESLSLPSAGEPDVYNRQRMQQRLHQSTAGTDLLQAARQIKIKLQNEKTATVTLAGRSWSITQSELGDRVLTPYIQRLQREVNALLESVRFQSHDIKHIICSGGTGSIRAIATWLQNTFTQATISQDVYQGNSAANFPDNTVPGCSRVAYGLATVPLHPTLVDWANRQSCDYDILMELARILPDRPLRLREILELLERRGISVVTSRPLLNRLLEGKLPPSLVPQGIAAENLTPDSNENPAYQDLRTLSLFIPVGADTYVINRSQWMQLQRYLSTLMVGTRQTSFQPQVGMQVY